MSRRELASLCVTVMLITCALNACAPTPTPTALVATEAPAEVPTEAPAEVPTEAPAEVPTEAPAEPPADVIVGAVYPFTGSGATTGEAARIGLEMAMEVINNAHPEIDAILAESAGLPNLGGAKCVFEFGDSETNAQKGAIEVERLINEGVAAILGLAYSSASAAAQPVCERYGIPLVSAISSSPPLTEQGYEWYFRVGPHDAQAAVAMFDVLDALREERGASIETIVVIHEDTEAGVEGANAQLEIAEERGYEVVERIQYHRDATSLTTEVQRIMAADPDVLMPTGYVADNILLLKTMKEFDYLPSMILWGGGSVVIPFFIEAVGEDNDYTMTRSRFSADLAESMPVVEQVAPIWDEKSGGLPYSSAETTMVVYAGATVICDAINRAGSTDPEAIRRALLLTDIPLGKLPVPYGVQFDPLTHHNARAIMKIDQMFDATWMAVYPFEIASRELVYPMPPWSER